MLRELVKGHWMPARLLWRALRDRHALAAGRGAGVAGS
jgi:hypothetical protein